MERSAQIDRQTLAIFWRASLRYKTLLLQGLLFPLGALLSGVVVPLYVGKTLGALALPNGRPVEYLVIFAVAAGVGILCNRIGHPILMKHQALVLRDAQELALATLFKRSVGFHNNNIGGKLVSDALDYPIAYSRLHDAVATTLLPALTLAVGSVVIYVLSWPLGLCITAMTVVAVGTGIIDSRNLRPRRLRRMQTSKSVTAHLADTISNIQTAKTFSREAYELRRHRRLSDQLTAIRIRDWRQMSTMGNTRMLLLSAMQVGLIFVVIHMVRHNPAVLGVGIFAFSFTLALSNKLFELNALVRNLDEALLQAAPMTAIIQQTAEIRDVSGAKRLRVRGGSVVFDGVSFAYPDAAGSGALFTDLNLAIKAGEKVGLVGPSGGGKSTLTRMLLRFDDVAEGRIAIDGQTIASVTQASLRQSIAYVPQEPLLFHRSIRENIAYGQPAVGLRAVRKAASLAHADEFISRLPEGYNTTVGERGVKLSGGQRQRVAIARAIVKDAPILVLDEATSALDSESEVLIQEALWRLMKGRTTLVVAHRLSTIQKMDRIVVLDGGKIVEQGTHRQLLERHGLYAKLWSHQSGGFLQGDS